MTRSSRPTILLVEDSPTDALLVRHALRKEYDVDIAATGQEARGLLESGSYLFVISDYKLPGMTGLDLLAWIQRKGINVPVIIASSQGDERVAASALKQGAYDYVIKSEDSITALPIVVRQALRRFELERRNLLLTQIVEDAQDTILTVDFHGLVKTANRAVNDMFGLAPEDAVGRPVSDLLESDPPGSSGVEAALTAVKDGRPWTGEFVGIRAHGETFPVRVSASVLSGRRGAAPESLIAIISDISERLRMVKELERLSITDELTGLFNHRYFRDKFHYEFLRSERYRHPLSLIMMDLDFFKTVNDTYGHHAGDEALREIARRVRKATRDVDIVTRYGGEEFAVLLPETGPQGAGSCAEHIRVEICRTAISLDEGEVRVTASLGWASLEVGVCDEEELLRRADRSLYSAKARGRDNVCSWDQIRVEKDTPPDETPIAGLRSTLRQISAQVKAGYVESVQAFLDRLLEPDPFLLRHIRGVTTWAARLARALDLDEDAIEIVRNAAIFHDLGKLGVPDAILVKPGPLTPEERAAVNGHVAVCEELAAEIGLFDSEMPLIRHHHERYDGRGFPDGIEGDQIPVGARILAVADAWEAMTSDRPFRESLTAEKAVAELRRCAGAQFDPQMVEAFVPLLAAAPPEAPAAGA